MGSLLEIVFSLMSKDVIDITGRGRLTGVNDREKSRSRKHPNYYSQRESVHIANQTRQR